MPSCLALSTSPNREEALRLAHVLVEERLAACVNLVDSVESVYRWQDAIQQDTEVLLLIKTRSENVAALEARLHQLHSYDIPELIVLEINGGSSPYLAWLQAQVKP